MTTTNDVLEMLTTDDVANTPKRRKQRKGRQSRQDVVADALMDLNETFDADDIALLTSYGIYIPEGGIDGA